MAKKDKTAEREPRPANVIQTSRRGNKVVGVIDKHTGKPIGEEKKVKKVEG